MGPLIVSGLVAVSVVIAGVALAFMRCAVAELAVRLAVRLYAPPGARREVQREIWLDTIQQLDPKERPSHAGSLLWTGVVGFGFQRTANARMRLELMLYANEVASWIDLCESLNGTSARVGRLRRWPGVARAGVTARLDAPLHWCRTVGTAGDMKDKCPVLPPGLMDEQERACLLAHLRELRRRTDRLHHAYKKYNRRWDRLNQVALTSSLPRP
jgi:hypothetical protein